ATTTVCRLQVYLSPNNVTRCAFLGCLSGLPADCYYYEVLLLLRAVIMERLPLTLLADILMAPDITEEKGQLNRDKGGGPPPSTIATTATKPAEQDKTIKEATTTTSKTTTTT
ncbi:unnamed protein product, partial [Laminaria digitata]